MELEEFVLNFAEQFDETDICDITPATEYHELDEWSSLTGMSVMAMVKTKYGKTVSGKEIKDCETVQELFELVKNK